MDWPYLHYAQFTPKGHSLIMVYNYDIFYRLGPRTFESYRVTDDAIPGVIYNGIPDWLYEGSVNDLFLKQFRILLCSTDVLLPWIVQATY